ncbi:hypothetical protein [Bradyrhizobium brasilense]|uniref:hypothetical protein n=1 Tax=Bradyrhizobium brasilense TaxID=1419277 RepID=UPI001E648545|nr:hypothetical protein [Bradyrhizobium brasilense]MCC8973823.1 hypothetical protein [Bradyrhizobium brasilense]
MARDTLRLAHMRRFQSGAPGVEGALSASRNLRFGAGAKPSSEPAFQGLKIGADPEPDRRAVDRRRDRSHPVSGFLPSVESNPSNAGSAAAGSPVASAWVRLLRENPVRATAAKTLLAGS